MYNIILKLNFIIYHWNNGYIDKIKINCKNEIFLIII